MAIENTNINATLRFLLPFGLKQRIDMVEIGWNSLLYMLLPLFVVGFYMYRWGLGVKTLFFASIRMFVQLLAIGYVLVYIFENNHWIMASLIVFIMIGVASLISLRNVKQKRVFYKILPSIAFSSILTLCLVIVVIGLDPWYQARYVVPLAGMIVMSSMNVLSLYVERLQSELEKNSFKKARLNAFNASLIPLINGFLAVGLVSLPGMMTGQILSGVSPLIAIRYQMVVMLMGLSSGGGAVIIYDYLTHKDKSKFV